jgi:hypothetical protein
MMWWYIGTALAGLAILVLQKFLRKSPLRSPSPKHLPTPPPASPSPQRESTPPELPEKKEPPKNTAINLKKSADLALLRQSPGRPETQSPARAGSMIVRSPAGRNASPALKKGPSEVMLSGLRRSGSAISRSGDRSPRRSASPLPPPIIPRPITSPIRAPPSPSPVQQQTEPIEAVSHSSPRPHREIRINESPVGTPARTDSAMELSSSASTTDTVNTTITNSTDNESAPAEGRDSIS